MITRNRFLIAISLLAGFLTAPFSPLQAQPQAQRKAIPVLIVDGFNNHDWKQTTKVAEWLLTQSGLFRVDVSTVPADSIERLQWRPDFRKYQVIIQNTNNLNNKNITWPKAAQKALEKYVAGGGGLLILHSANNSFPEWDAYNKMIALGWRDKSYGYSIEIDSTSHALIRHKPGESNGTTHGQRFDATITILNRHPINEGYPAAWKTADTEVYSDPRGPAENMTVLSYAYDINTKKCWPTEWVIRYGKGNVYNSVMGHLWAGDIYPRAWRCAGYQTTFIRAAEWLATGKVTYPVPSDFPTAESTNLRAESGYLK